MSPAGEPLVHCVVPVHNDADTIEAEVAGYIEQISALSASFQLWLAENGSADDSARVIRTLEGPAGDRITVHAASIEPAGIGHAYHHGMQRVFSTPASPGQWILLTAGDFPFGITDLEGFLPFARRYRGRAIAVGSKAHRDSRIRTRGKRQIPTLVYRALRRGIVGMRTRDSQGTVFMARGDAQLLATRVRSRDFFYSTELVYWAERLGYAVEELPVQLRPCIRPSTVRWSTVAPAMLRDLWRLRNDHGMIGDAPGE
ncbi:MAG: hypothetical protein OEZ06_24655 [Myxococcales bacterium]|nr:hypothetical protein [Myxococcales bacterium]